MNTQEKINNAYNRCEAIKDEIALLDAEYKATLGYLNAMCKSNGLHAQPKGWEQIEAEEEA